MCIVELMIFKHVFGNFTLKEKKVWFDKIVGPILLRR